MCERLLPYKEETAEMLLKSLTLVVGLPAGVAWDLADRTAAEVGEWVQEGVGGCGSGDGEGGKWVGREMGGVVQGVPWREPPGKSGGGCAVDAMQEGNPCRILRR